MAEKISKIALIALLVIGALSFIGSMFFDQHNFMIYLCYFYAVITIVGALVGGVVGAMNKPESIKGNIIGVVGMLVIFGLSYALASGEVLETYPKDITEFAVKMSDAGLIMLYIVGTLSIVSIIYAGVAQLLNRN